MKNRILLLSLLVLMLHSAWAMPTSTFRRGQAQGVTSTKVEKPKASVQPRRVAKAAKATEESVTLVMEDYAATQFTAQGITVSAIKDSAKNEPVYNANYRDVRVYAKGKLTVSSSQTITGISFVLSNQGLNRLASLTSNVGTMAVSTGSAAWYGSANEVTITVGEKADYGSESGKAGQLCFTALTVTLLSEGGQSEEATPITVQLDPASTEANGWGQVSLWAWVTNGSGSQNVFDTWPGVPVSKDTATGWWSYTFDNLPEGDLNIIWNNGGGGYQTPDINQVSASTCYQLGSSISLPYYSCSVTTCPGDSVAPVDPLPVDSTIPTVSVLQTAGYNPTENIVFCAKFGGNVCNGVVFTGTYNNWSSDPDSCRKMTPLPGFEGWYAVEVPYTESAGGKPIALSSEGEFSWDYQPGDVTAWIHKGGEEAFIHTVYADEAEVNYLVPGAYIYEIAYWKKHVDPCHLVPHTYTVNVYAPDACPEMKPALWGGFNGWAEELLMTEMTDTNNKTYYSATLTTTEGTEFKFRAAGDETASWNQFQYNDNGVWTYFSGNNTFADQEMITFDYSDNTRYRFSECEQAPSPSALLTIRDGKLERYTDAWQMVGYTANADTLLTFVVTDTILNGQFEAASMLEGYSYIKAGNTYYIFQSGTISIAYDKSAGTAVITGTVNAVNDGDNSDVKEFTLDVKAALFEPYGNDSDTPYQGQYTSFDADTTYFASEHRVNVTAFDEGNKVLILSFFSSTYPLQPGTYPISFSNEIGTVQASTGARIFGGYRYSLVSAYDENYDYATPQWFLVEGTVKIYENGAIEVNALNSKGVAVTAVVGQLPQDEGITATEAMAIGAELAQGAKTAETYKIYGYVTRIEANAISTYGNMTFYIDDVVGGEDKFYVYRGKTDIEFHAGDYICVESQIYKYGTNSIIESVANTPATLIRADQTPAAAPGIFDLTTQATSIDDWTVINATFNETESSSTKYVYNITGGITNVNYATAYPNFLFRTANSADKTKAFTILPGRGFEFGGKNGAVVIRNTRAGDLITLTVAAKGATACNFADASNRYPVNATAQTDDLTLPAKGSEGGDEFGYVWRELTYLSLGGDVQIKEFAGGYRLRSIVLAQGEPIDTSKVLSVAQALEFGAMLNANTPTVNSISVAGYVVNPERYEQVFDNQTFYLSDNPDSTSNVVMAYYATPEKNGQPYPVLAGDYVIAHAPLERYVNKSTGEEQIELVRPTVEFISEMPGDRTLGEIVDYTVADALARAESMAVGYMSNAVYNVYGYVSAIVEDAMSTYGNMSFWIADDPTSRAAGKDNGAFYVYRGKPDRSLQVGDRISIRTHVHHVNRVVSGDTLIVACSTTGAPITYLSPYSDAPTAADLQNAGYNTTDNLVLCCRFLEEICNEVVFAGNYAVNPDGSWITNPDSLAKFAPLPGFEGWYAVQVPYWEGAQGKPVQLKSDGTFSWDYQAGDADAWIYRGGNQANIYAGFVDECDVLYPSAGAYIYDLAYFKRHHSPCGEQITYNYTIRLCAPDACPEMKPGIIGSFNNWESVIPMTEHRIGAGYVLDSVFRDSIRTRFIPPTTFVTDTIKIFDRIDTIPADTLCSCMNKELKSYYTFSLQAEPGVEFKLREVNDPDWSNQIVYYDEASGQWYDFSNFVLDIPSDYEWIIDLSDNKHYRYALCDAPLPEDTVQCYYNLEMIDSYGDGWNGGQLIIRDGFQEMTYTLDQGSYARVQVPYYGNTVYGYWVAGSYDSEVGISITSPNTAGLYYHAPGTTLNEGELFVLTESPCRDEENPYIPQNIRAELQQRTLVVSWNAVSGASYYYVNIISPDGQWNYSNNVYGISVTVEGLPKNGDYTVVVTSVNADGLPMGTATETVTLNIPPLTSVQVGVLVPSDCGMDTTDGVWIYWFTDEGEHIEPMTAVGGCRYEATIHPNALSYNYSVLNKPSLSAEGVQRTYAWTDLVDESHCSEVAYFGDDDWTGLYRDSECDNIDHDYRPQNPTVELKDGAATFRWTMKTIPSNCEIVAYYYDDNDNLREWYGNTLYQDSANYTYTFRFNNSKPLTVAYWSVNCWTGSFWQAYSQEEGFIVPGNSKLPSNLAASSNGNGTYTLTWKRNADLVHKLFAVGVLNQSSYDEEWVINEQTVNGESFVTPDLSAYKTFVWWINIYDEAGNQIGQTTSEFAIESAAPATYERAIHVYVPDAAGVDKTAPYALRWNYPGYATSETILLQSEGNNWYYTYLTLTQPSVQVTFLNAADSTATLALTCTSNLSNDENYLFVNKNVQGNLFFRPIDSNYYPYDYLPFNLTATPGVGKVTLKWTSTTNAMRYVQIYNAQGETISSTWVDTDSCQFVLQVDSTEICTWSVRSETENGVMDQNAIVYGGSFTVEPSPYKPRNLKATLNADGTCTISWSPVEASDLSYYYVTVYDPAGWNIYSRNVGTDTSFVTDVLPAAGQYNYYINAYGTGEDYGYTKSSFYVDPQEQHEIVARLLIHPDSRFDTSAGVTIQIYNYQIDDWATDTMASEGNCWYRYAIRTTNPGARIRFYSEESDYTSFLMGADGCFQYSGSYFSEADCDTKPHDYRVTEGSLKAISEPGRVRFSWQAPDVADTYQLRVYELLEDSTEYYLGYLSIYSDTTFLWMLTDEYVNRTYRWTVKTSSPVNTDEVLATEPFTTLPAEIELSDLAVSTADEVTYDFSWQSNTKGLHYQIDIINYDYYVKQEIVATPYYRFTVPCEGNYSWRVRAVDPKDNSPLTAFVYGSDFSVTGMPAYTNLNGSAQGHTLTFTWESKLPYAFAAVFFTDNGTYRNVYQTTVEGHQLTCEVEEDGTYLIQLQPYIEYAPGLFSILPIYYHTSAQAFEGKTYSLVLNETEGGYIWPEGMSGNYPEGYELRVQAILTQSGYNFVGWSDGVKDSERTIVISSDTTITAIFAPVQPNNYTIRLYQPDACEQYLPAVVGSFTNWTDNLPMTAKRDSLGNTCYELTVAAMEGDAFKFREVNDLTWENEFVYLSGDYWYTFPDNYLGEDTLLVFDYSDNATYRYQQCTEDVLLTGFRITSADSVSATVTWNSNTDTVRYEVQLYYDNALIDSAIVDTTVYGFTAPYQGYYRVIVRAINPADNQPLTEWYWSWIYLEKAPVPLTDLVGEADEHTLSFVWKSLTSHVYAWLYNANYEPVFSGVIEGNHWIYEVAEDGVYILEIRPCLYTDSAHYAELPYYLSTRVQAFTVPTYPVSIQATEGGYLWPDNLSGNYPAGYSFYVDAYAENGYRFVGWSDGETVSYRNVTIGGETNLTALFELIPVYGIRVQATEGGLIRAGYMNGYDSVYTDSLREESVISLSAKALEGYTFDCWSDGVTTAGRTLTLTSDTTLTAIFHPLCYLALTSENGSIAFTGDYYHRAANVYTLVYGTEVQIEAVPDSGYRFLRWSDEVTTIQRTLTVTGDLELTALFEAMADSTVQELYTVLVTTTGNGLGAVNTTGGSYYGGTSIQLIATPAANSVFDGWSDGVTENPRTLVVSQDTTIAARFAVRQYTLTLAAEQGGVVPDSLNGAYDYGTAISITAETNKGYRFVGWSDGNAEQTRTVYMTSDLALTALFELIPTYTLTLEAGVGGTVLLDAVPVESGKITTQYEENYWVNLSAQAQNGYRFLRWSDGDKNIDRFVQMNRDYSLTAIFEQVVRLTLATTEGGTVALSGDAYEKDGEVYIFAYGAEARVTAQVNEGYRFLGWSDGDKTMQRVLTLTADLALTAQFALAEATPQYTITIRTAGNGTGTVNISGGTYYEGDQIQLIATPASNSDFIGWSDGSMDNPRLLTVTEDLNLTATFALRTYALAVRATEGGTVNTEVNGRYEYGSYVNLVAAPAEHYHFLGWSDGATAASRYVFIKQDTTLVAQFEIDSHTIIFRDEDGSVLDSISCAYGIKPVSSVTPVKEADVQYTYTFAGWTPEITAVTGDATYTATYTATLNSYPITWLNADSSLIDVTEVAYGAMPVHADAEKAATAQYTYTFKGWTPALTEVTGAATYKAEFDSVVNLYTVTFVDSNDSVLSVQQVLAGQAAELPAEPQHEGYRFVQWTIIEGSGSLDSVMSDLTVKATYEEILYTVYCFDQLDNSLIAELSVREGTAAQLPEPPVHEGYIFVEWQVSGEGDLNNVRSNIIVWATYRSEQEGIDGVQTDRVQGTKVLRNGVIYILRDGKTYTLTGQGAQ